PGKVPTRPLCYGGWVPLGQDNAYGRKDAELYAALGFRSLHPAHSGPKGLGNPKAGGILPTKSWRGVGSRKPPTPTNIQRGQTDAGRHGLEKELLFFDYGDEIAFSEWLGMMADEDVARLKAAGQKVTAQQVIAARWVEWLRTNRPKNPPSDYWLDGWGPLNR